MPCVIIPIHRTSINTQFQLVEWRAPKLHIHESVLRAANDTSKILRCRNANTSSVSLMLSPFDKPAGRVILDNAICNHLTAQARVQYQTTTKQQWDMLISEYFGFALSVTFHQCCICINSCIANAKQLTFAIYRVAEYQSKQRNLDCLHGLGICQFYEATDIINDSPYGIFRFVQYSVPSFHIKY